MSERSSQTKDQQFAEMARRVQRMEEKLQLLLGERGPKDDSKTAVRSGDVVAILEKHLKTLNDESLVGDGNITISISALWGAITGSITDQADLVAALGGKSDSSHVHAYPVGAQIPSSLRPGLSWSHPTQISSAGSVALTANRLYFMPVVIPYATTLTELSFQCTGGATNSMRLGLYAVAADGGPGLLLADSGTLAMGASGKQAATVNVTVPAGQYYLAAVFSFPGAAPNAQSVGNTWGHVRDSTSSTNVGIRGYYRAFTFGALPADETGAALTAVLSGGGVNIPNLMVG